MLYIFGGLPGTGKSTRAKLGAGVAESLEIPFVEIEVVCSDEYEHRHRVTTRTTDIPGFKLPTWDEVKNRHYEVWDRDHIVIDTAHQTVEESLKVLRELLGLKTKL